MNSRFATLGALRWMFAGALIMALSIPGFAVLGDNAASVLHDQTSMNGTLRSVDNQTYVLHEISAANGAKIREYVSPSGIVFGIAWEGQFPPNFQQLLGPYYQQAQQAIADQKAASQQGEQKTPQRRGPLLVNTSGLVLMQSGHSRNFRGRVYIPQLIPAGVQASEIR